MGNNTDDYLEGLYSEAVGQRKGSREDMKRSLASLLGKFEETSLQVRKAERETETYVDYKRERHYLNTTAGLEMPIYVFTPKEKTGGSVLAIHGHGYGSRELAGLSKEGKLCSLDNGLHKHFAVSLVRRGLTVYVPEMIGFGERRLQKDKEKENVNSCYRLAVHLLMNSKTLAGLRVFEMKGALDIIRQEERGKIGVMGFSGGGWIAALLAVLDSRIDAAVLSGFAGTFKGSILASDHCLDNYIPGLLQVGELPEILELIAPRPLFIETGREDTTFPSVEAEKAYHILKGIYGDAGASDCLAIDVFEGGHKVSGRKSLDWLKEMLK
ncbi:dienelactone hydrolase family protein [Halobacillus sp. Marseille-Q1614]|uniref:dienelactone hydrolase family protein n=1 Tax=Halobacillus sp. Marseille-Q1614 TaxID=2709134 RepID=UPI0015715B21|nr:alpha/beta hydrolase family protein [Halobacillus sp. Marseille-Q1614]